MIDYNGKRVLVTGAGGFIGSHLSEKLVELGAEVNCFIRYNSRNDWGLIELLPPHIKDKLVIVKGDLKDSDCIRKSIKDIDIIFHLGSVIAIPYSYVNPRDVVETNVIGTLNVLSAASENDIEKIVHTSTSEVYGTAKYVPIDEEHPLQGQSPYSASKISADKIAESFYLSYGMPISIIRPFNTYGPRQSARAIIPSLMSQILGNDEVTLGSTNPTRDFTYVSDTVKGFIMIAESPKSIGEVINIGSGKEISIGDLTSKIISIVGKNVKIAVDENRIRPIKSEVGRLCANNEKAKRLLGWQPRVSLEEGLRSTCDWISNNLGLYKSRIYNI